MLHYYKRTLIDLFTKTQRLRESPIENRELCLEIQESIIKKITYIENRIRKLKHQIKCCRKELRIKRSLPLTKDRSTEIKNRIKANQNHIDHYQTVLSIFRDIGDALAFIYIDKWDIKPMSFKQAPGFISRKKGSRLERRCMRGAFEKGGVALLNDLTHSLRYGDLTVPKEGAFLLFEMKSGRSKNIREERQIIDIKNIYEYLTTDRTQNLYELQGEMVRTPMHSAAIYHLEKINSLIPDALNHGVVFVEAEKGLFYFVATRFESELLDQGIKLCKKTPIVAHLNSTRYLQMGGYYPFTLSIRDAEALYKFYIGELNIVVIVDSGIIEEYLAHKGYNVKFLEEDKYAMEISKMASSQKDLEFIRVSWHFFGRMPAEFLSLKWFLDESIHGMLHLCQLMKSLVYKMG